MGDAAVARPYWWGEAPERPQRVRGEIHLDLTVDVVMPRIAPSRDAQDVQIGSGGRSRHR